MNSAQAKIAAEERRAGTCPPENTPWARTAIAADGEGSAGPGGGEDRAGEGPDLRRGGVDLIRDDQRPPR